MSRRRVVLLLRRELEGDGPAGGPGGEAHGALLGEGVDLHDHTVYLVGKGASVANRLLAEVAHLAPGGAALHVRVHVEARLAKPGQQLPLALGRKRRLVGHGVQERGQIAHGGDGRVLLPQASRGGVAGIGEGLLARKERLGVQRLEAGLGHVHLAAKLEGARRVGQAAHRLPAQAQRDVLHGAHVRRHVLARGAVTAGGRPHQPSVLVGECNGGTVDLQLAHHGNEGSEGLLHPVHPGGQLVQVHGVVQRVHAPLVAHGGELLAHVAAHALGGAGRVGQLGMGRLQFSQLAHERVEGPVGYLRGVQGVVQVGVVLYLAAQRLHALPGVRNRTGCPVAAAHRLPIVRHLSRPFPHSAAPDKPRGPTIWGPSANLRSGILPRRGLAPRTGSPLCSCSIRRR